MNRGLIPWQTLLLAVLCGTPALWADVCSGLPGGPANGWDYWPDPQKDGRAPGIFRLQPKPRGPAFRITVTTIASPSEIHETGDIQVDRCQDGKQLQQFALMADQPINFGLSLDTTDINFDGYLDFSVLTEYAAGWKARAYWIYDPASQRFVKNELTHKLENDWKGNLVNFDSKRHEISLGLLMAYAACKGAEPDVYSVSNNHAILVHTVQIDGYAPERCTVKVWNMVGGTLRVTSERRVDREGNPVGPNDVPPPARIERPAKLLPPTQPPPAPGALLYEHPLDAAKEGLLSNVPESDGTGRTQVGADRFIIPTGATVTGLRWYGYGSCLGGPGASQAFKIAFFLDQSGTPAGGLVATAQVQALVNPTASIVTDSYGNRYQVFLYTVNTLPPLTIPPGRRTWLVVQGFGSCSFFWNRSTFSDSETALAGLAYAIDPTRYSEWVLLEAHLAFSLYGAE